MPSLVIVVLGSPNDPQGRLYSVARERCHLAALLAGANPAAKLLLTGGFGEHFNTAPLPHAEYLRRTLTGLGVEPSRYLPDALSRNTIEDASLSKPIVLAHSGTGLLVVTSDFHVPRARFLFEREFRESCITVAFVACETDERACELDLVALKQHERRALTGLKLQAT